MGTARTNSDGARKKGAAKRRPPTRAKRASGEPAKPAAKAAKAGTSASKSSAKKRRTQPAKTAKTPKPAKKSAAKTKSAQPKVAQPKITKGVLESAWAHELIESTSDLACVCVDGQVQFINGAGLRMIGLEAPEDILGRPIADVFHADYRSLAQNLSVFFGADPHAIPVKFLRADGKDVDVEITVVAAAPADPDDRTFVVWARDISDQVQSAETLREREARLRGILDGVSEAIITADDRGIIQNFNAAAEHMFGYMSAEMVGKSINLLMGDDDRATHDRHVARYVKTGRSEVMGMGRELVGRRKDGSLFPLELGLSELRRGQQRVFTAIMRDITERRNAEMAERQAKIDLEERVAERTQKLTREIVERKLAEGKLRLAATVIETTNEAVMVTDREFRVSSVNPAYTRMTGFDADEIVGKPILIDDIRNSDSLKYEQMKRAIKDVGQWEGEIWCRRKTGEDYAVRVAITEIRDDTQAVLQYTALISDITQRKRDEERIRYQASYDALTGLPNRALFIDRLTQTLAQARRGDYSVALMFIDLDGFKLVNDTLGHDVGDVLLKETASRLKLCIREVDTLARLGGDEFTVIMPQVDNPRNAAVVANRICESIGRRFVLGGEEIYVSASIGITVFPQDGEDQTELLKNADAAMYRAKEQGKDNFHFFTEDLNREAKERLVLKNGLGKAINANEFRLFYQPKLEIGTGLVTGVEALLRWRTEELGDVSPDRFVPILEETGLINQVGQWALETACKQQRMWSETGLPDLRVAVNLSPRQLRQPDFIDSVGAILTEHGVDGSGLEVEITENMLMSDTERAVAALNQLKELGIHVSMDDFGTGYSSLSYLKRFPINTIKIDRSFVADIANDQDDLEIIKAIITMGQTLGRRIVAEGVENEDQLEILRQFGCDELQGYLFCKPLPAGEITEFLRALRQQANARATENGHETMTVVDGVLIED